LYGHTCTPLSPTIPSPRQTVVLLSQHIARLLSEERDVVCCLAAGHSVQWIELAVKIAAGSQAKTYLNPRSSSLQTPLLGAMPPGLGLAFALSSPPCASPDPNFPVHCMGQRALPVPLQLLFPPPYILVPSAMLVDISLAGHF